MRALIAPDAFKGTFSAAEVATSIAEGMRAAGAQAQPCPVADGGEGTLSALAGPLSLRLQMVDVRDALGQRVQAPIGLASDRTAVVEAAAAIGIAQLHPDELNPLAASSQGAGELISHALEAGAGHLLVAVGGSATVDGGSGALAAISDLAALRRRNVEVLCDVKTSFERAAAVYAPQKGASPADAEALSRRLDAFAATLPRDPRGVPFTGAAGGLSGALWAHGATLQSGAERVLDLIGFDAKLAQADVLITGEGCLDAQTAEGKLVAEVAARAAREGVLVVALVGKLNADAATIRSIGLHDVMIAGDLASLARAGFQIAAGWRGRGRRRRRFDHPDR